MPAPHVALTAAPIPEIGGAAVPSLAPISDQPGRLIVNSLLEIDLTTLRGLVRRFLDEGAAG